MVVVEKITSFSVKSNSKNMMIEVLFDRKQDQGFAFPSKSSLCCEKKKNS